MGTALGILLATLVGMVAVVVLVPIRLAASGTFTDAAVDGHALVSWGFVPDVVGMVQKARRAFEQPAG